MIIYIIFIAFREDLSNDLKSLELWIIENENILEAEVSPETVNSILEMYHVFLQEHTEKQPLVTDIGERISGAQYMIPNYENLLSKYQVSFIIEYCLTTQCL